MERTMVKFDNGNKFTNFNIVDIIFNITLLLIFKTFHIKISISRKHQHTP